MKARRVPNRKSRPGLRRDRHTVSMLTDHLIFCTKYRAPVLTPEIAYRCEQVIRQAAKDINVEIKEIAVNPEHVHIFLVYPPKYSPSYVAMRLKWISSYLLRQEFPELNEFCPKGLWAKSCFHSSVGQGFDVVERYIKNQDQHHR